MTLIAKYARFPIDLEKLSSFTTTSAKMRYLHGILGTYYAVADFMNRQIPRDDGKEWRVQHVRNVMVTPVKTPKG